MISSIYRRLKRDFNFLEDDGFVFSCKYRHHVTPSIEFKNQGLRIQIGFSYESKRIFIYVYNPKCEDVLETEKDLESLSYRKQVEIGIDMLQKILKKSNIIE